MPISQLSHRRTHNLLLISRLFSCRDNVSPFTLLLDSLEQSAAPVAEEMIARAKSGRLRIAFLAFGTLRCPRNVDAFIDCVGKSMDGIRKEVLSIISASPSTRTLLVIDSLNALSATVSEQLSGFLGSLIAPQVNLLGIYHLDIPAQRSSSGLQSSLLQSYAPSPFSLLTYLATTIITVHSPAQQLARRASKNRSLAEPSFGLSESVEGVVAGLGSNDRRGAVLEVEHRRKSGREIIEWYFLPYAVSARPGSQKETIMLLDDWPLYHDLVAKPDGEPRGEENVEGLTFDLGLTERQKREREGVVLPYFDAQRDEGVGQGGRIIYDMGVEDDFDEEEDEI
ncbi:putative killer toxin sensitivity protein [Eremomyces bilateralis CBS 781.70]|uniref:Elongator complex protein 5 n=1 Tax=Eremomyces bilateralis CBS 781.70 TaxID=1392243 RepID=A0A6G1FYP9_9PEZI|nr:putative killer toxin sensitivity protein [Eremomyces bilateralis CBS 781.70]KAF1810995.1 putative killer toxin sensitivity protein [Eremomyces bilateralis CBS 781.70]